VSLHVYSSLLHVYIYTYTYIYIYIYIYMRPCVRVCVCACVYTIIAVFCLFIGVFCMFIGVFCILIGVHCICLGVFCMFKVNIACLCVSFDVFFSSEICACTCSISNGSPRFCCRLVCCANSLPWRSTQISAVTGVTVSCVSCCSVLQCVAVWGSVLQ